MRAELIVQTGRLKGVRRAMTAPVTLMGQASICEVRLNVEGIEPIHCVVAQCAEGFILRDLETEVGTKVNGVAVSSRLLCNGDTISVGPFQFLFELTGEARDPNFWARPEELQAEREAIRIQAAAVVAQQAGMMEEELRLEQRRLALDKQEEQLASRLEDRRKKLLELQKQVRDGRKQLETERDAFAKWETDGREAILREQSAIEEIRKKADKERLRCVELRKRLKRRWKRHWSLQEAMMQKREAKLLQEMKQLDQERAKFQEQHLRYNGQIEIGRREVLEARLELERERKAWQGQWTEAQQELHRTAAELEQQSAQLQQREQKLAHQQNRWQQIRQQLEKEAAGLDARIRQQRPLLVNAQPALSEPPSPPGLSSIETHLIAPSLEDLAGLLADQRLHLLEQWQHLLQVDQAWHRERQELLAEMEELGLGLQLREEELQQRETAIESKEARIDQRLRELADRQAEFQHMRYALEERQVRLTLESAEQERELQRQRMDLEAREMRVVEQVRHWTELDARRTQRLQKELDQLKGMLQRTATIRQQYSALWKECSQRRSRLIRAKQDLATEALALGRLRQQLLDMTDKPSQTEKYLDSLRRRIRLLHAKTRKELAQSQNQQAGEWQRIDQRARDLEKREADLVHRTWDLERLQIAWENQQHDNSQADQQRRWELHQLQRQHQLDQRQLEILRAEVESVALALLEEEGNTSPVPNLDQATNQAA